jgi:hypothetical protein
MDLGKVGIWWSRSWETRDDVGLNTAAEIESLGYKAIWSSGGFGSGLSEHFERLLTATSHVAVASGIVTIWTTSPEQIA